MQSTSATPYNKTRNECGTLYDIFLLRNLLMLIDDMYDASTLSNYLQSFYAITKPQASTINILAESAYKLFCASADPAMKKLRQASFDYIEAFSHKASYMEAFSHNLYLITLSLWLMPAPFKPLSQLFHHHCLCSWWITTSISFTTKSLVGSQIALCE
ncbi:hypothetical protein C2S53_006508 [Perilla frutescens var. hirtella]|uniref:Squalene monooxygenase n=1 Tax=Perilla frutescens var. hirtella TaxID=608512 RepID=A0AAD4P2D0_PERFH|nr:hypothetical protein C2S53_006508 [Perilla frutescens var. hirtella]